MTTNWQNNLGGAVEGLGSGIRDLSMISALVTINGPTFLTKLHIVLMVSGTILNLIGKAISKVFPADSPAIVAAVAEHSQAIAQIKNDTAAIKKP